MTSRLSVKNMSDDRSSAISRAGHSRLESFEHGLPSLEAHEKRTATHGSGISPLRSSDSYRAHDPEAGSKGVELQQLNGPHNIHPLLAENRPGSSCWDRLSLINRIIMISCVMLGLVLVSVVAYQVHAVIAESSRRQRDEVDGPVQQSGRGCHWTQIRLPTSLSTPDVSIQVHLSRPTAPFEEVKAFLDIGKDYAHCFVVFTQGTATISSSALEGVPESGVVKLTRHSGVYLILFREQQQAISEPATLKIHFDHRAPQSILWRQKRADTQRILRNETEEVTCWRECIDYDSVCEDGHGRQMQEHGWHLSPDTRACEEITTCADQRTVHLCGWCQMGTSVTSGRGIACTRDEMLPDMNCIPQEPCPGFWTWRSSDCPMMGNGVCVLKVICKRYRKSCVGYHEV
uniref:Uncharacterized protein n=1 Tax=Tetraselmis sp. GSL018 TaxID=582737 RepID=A0A061SBL5_9CHLO